MARGTSFTETATLKVVDQSTATINRINEALAALKKTAAGFNKAGKDKGGVAKEAKDGTKAVKEAAKAAEKVQRDQKRAAAEKTKITAAATRQARTQEREEARAVAANIKRHKELSATQQAVERAGYKRDSAKRVRREAARDAYDAGYDPNKRRRRYGASGSGLPPEQPPPLPGGGSGARRAPGGGGGRTGLGDFARGFGQGLPGPIGGILSSFSLLEAAGRAAAEALNAVAEAGIKRDKTNLMGSLLATDAQKKQLAAAEDARAKDPRTKLMTRDESERFTYSLLGDIPAEIDRRDKNPFTAMANAEDRQMGAAIKLRQQLEEGYIPRMYALHPDKSREENLEGLRQVVQGLNLASPDLINKKTGELSPDAQRALNAAQVAQIIDPGITSQQVKTAYANNKTAIYSQSEEGLTRMLLNVGARGMRGANENFRAMQSATGTVDVKKLNEMWYGMGLLKDVKRSGKKQTIDAGSGTPVDEKGLLENPAKWFNENFVPKMNEDIKKTKAAKDRMAEAGKGGASAEEIAEAGMPTPVEIKAWIGKKMSGASAAAVQGVTDLIVGYDQQTKAVEYGKRRQMQPIDPMLRKSAAAQWESIKVRATDLKDMIGQKAFEKLDVAGYLDKVNRAAADPTGPAAAELATDTGRRGLSALLNTSPLMVGGRLLIEGSTTLQAAAEFMQGIWGKLGDWLMPGGGGEPQTDAMGASTGASDQRSATERAQEQVGREIAGVQDQLAKSDSTLAAIKKHEESTQRTLDVTKDKRTRGNLQDELNRLAAERKKIEGYRQAYEKEMNELREKKKTLDEQAAAAQKPTDPNAPPVPPPVSTPTTVAKDVEEGVVHGLNKVHLGKGVKAGQPGFEEGVPMPGARPKTLGQEERSEVVPNFDAAFNTAAANTKIQVEEPPLMQVDTSNLPMIKIDTSNLPTSIPLNVTGGGKPVDRGAATGTG